MDYTKLSDRDLDEIFEHTTVGDNAQEVFEHLKDDPNAVIPFPLLDLYISSIYEGPRDQIYQPEQILNLSQAGVDTFAPLFHLDTVNDDLKTNRQRILRILGYLDLLEFKYRILFQPTVLELMAEHLLSYVQRDEYGLQYPPIRELNHFRLAIDEERLDIKCEVKCNNKIIGEVPCLTDTSYELITKVELCREHQAISELIKANNYTAVKWLLKRGGNPNGCYQVGYNLELAAQEGYTDIVKLLLEYKADPNLYYHRHSLHSAVMNRDLELMRLLLKHGTRVDIGCPLLDCAEGGFTPGVKLLLEYNADLYERSNKNLSALNYASRGGFVELTRYLVELMTGLCVDDMDDLDLLQIAMYDNSPHFRELLMQYGAHYPEEESSEEECIVEIID